MSEGKQKGQTVQPTKLALAELKSVQWAQDQQIVMSVQKSAATRYQSYKESLLFGWVIVLSEMYVVWWWTFVHNLPWPEPALNALDKADTFTFRTLDYTQQRLEWWWDMASVRLMWLKESIINFLDRNLTVADSYFAMLQDWSAAVYEFITHFISGIYQTVANITSENLLGQKATTSGALNKNLSMRRNSEGYEDDETGDEEYLSDASRNARRMAKEDSSEESIVSNRTTAAQAEGKFREAMYHRVRNELGVMRKNSVRFSRGLVNYARQMVDLRSRQYGESFLEFCQKWARDLGILDLIATIQEELKDRPFLAKPLLLVRVLSEAWLGFLLRLVKGKRSRRTRSMRSESLRRRAMNPSGTSSPLPLSPALQQSSEPAQVRLPLTVPSTLREAALKEVEEDLEGFLSKDSALGSEDNRSESGDSEQTISPSEEGLESDSDNERRKKISNGMSGLAAQAFSSIREVAEEEEEEEQEQVEQKQPTISSDDSNTSPTSITRLRKPGIMSNPETLNKKSHLTKPTSPTRKKVTIC